jgi:hypothetical protein
MHYYQSQTLVLPQLVALVILLLRLSEHEAVETSAPLRILVSAQTNVAVDNILQVMLLFNTSYFTLTLALLGKCLVYPHNVT